MASALEKVAAILDPEAMKAASADEQVEAVAKVSFALGFDEELEKAAATFMPKPVAEKTAAEKSPEKKAEEKPILRTGIHIDSLLSHLAGQFGGGSYVEKDAATKYPALAKFAGLVEKERTVRPT